MLTYNEKDFCALCVAVHIANLLIQGKDDAVKNCLDILERPDSDGMKERVDELNDQLEDLFLQTDIYRPKEEE
jgi:hypothetical protein